MTQKAIKKLHYTMGEEKEVSESEDSPKSNGLFPVSKFMAMPNEVKPKVSAPGSSDTSFHLASLPRRRQQTDRDSDQLVRGNHAQRTDVVRGTLDQLTAHHNNPRVAVYITPSPEDNTQPVYGSLQRPSRERQRVNTQTAIAKVGALSTLLSVPTEAWTEGGSLGRRYQKRPRSTPPQVYRRSENGVIPGQHSHGPTRSNVYSSVNGLLSPHTVYDQCTKTSVTGRPVVWPVRSSSAERIPRHSKGGGEVASAAFTPTTHYNTLPSRTKQNSVEDSRSHGLNTKDTSNIVISKSNSEFIMMGNYYDPQELYGTHTRTSNLLKSKAKFSSMPSLFGARDFDKKAMKKEKKRIKEEEKRLKKEEKKRKKLEKKYATVNPNMIYSNWNYIQRPIEDVYMRPKLRLRAVPIDFEDGPSSRAPTVPPPPPPDIGLRRKYLHASAPDLLRLEQVYGSLSKERKTYTTAIYQQSEYAPRMVVLHKSPEGFGFVLRGARSQTHSGTLDFQPTAEFPALQYLDSVDPGSQADRVGLKAGDFLLEINGENVIRASHERVVQIIRAARSTLAMKVVTVRQLDRGSDWFVHQDGIMTLPNRKRQAPAPPRRDPQTSLSYSKATSKSMAEGLAEIEKLDQTLAEYDGNQHGRRMSMPNDPNMEPKTASVRAAHTAKRMSVVDLDSILVSEKTDQGKTKGKDYVSPSELRIMKYHKKQNGSVSNMERSKSTPDLAGEMVLVRPETVYAKSGVETGTGYVGHEKGGATWSKSRTPTVKPTEPASLRGPIYMTPSVKRPVTYIDPKVLQAAVSSGNAAKLNLSQEESPYSIPQVPNRQPTPKRPAPPPPVRGEVVSISTTAAAAATYANVSESIQKQKKQESPYESSFRPGTLARLTKQPQVSTQSLEQAKLKAHQRSASAGNIAVPPDADEADKPSVSFAEDKVYESAASFIQKHPNATLLVTADVHKGQKKDKNFYEPEPDYDVDSDEEKSVSSSSSTKVHGKLSRQSSSSSQKSSSSKNAGDNKAQQSVTVISVGKEGTQRSSPLNKRYTVHSDIPSSAAPYSSDSTKLVIPPRPTQPAPLPPSMPSSNSSSRRSSIQSNISGDISSDRINAFPPPPATSTVVVHSSQPVQTSYTTPPPQTAPPPPPPPPPVVAAPPPPPPPPPPPSSNPPPLPSSTPPQLRPVAPKHAPQGAPQVPTDAILAAVAKRQARMQTEGPLMAPDRPPPAKAVQKSKLELNHEALKAAVAKRKNLLEKVEDETVVDTIESKLQKTKKLQSAKYFFSSDTINRKDKTTAEKEEDQGGVFNTSTLQRKKAAAPPPPTVKPAAPAPAPAVQTKVKVAKPPQVTPSKPENAYETPANVTSENNSAETSQQSDFLALAERKRQEWLQKKSNNDTGTLKKNSTQASKSTDSSTNKIEVIPLKKDDPAMEDDSKVSIRDRIRKLEKANLNLNGTLKSPNVELGGVTEDHSHTEAGLTLSRNKKGVQNGSKSDNYGYIAPPAEFNDGKPATNAHGLIQIDIIPPPAHFANESSTDESGHSNEQFSSAFGHDDAASLVSSVSTLSTLSSEQGDGNGGSPPAKHAQSYDDMMPPPPPGFDDSNEQMYDEIQGDECIPPPPQFGSLDGKPKPVRPFQTKAVESWLCTDVMDWLDSLSMSQYRSSFAKNCIDGPKLIGLGRNDYIELGVVQVGHRMNLERSIKKVAMRKTAL